MCHYFIVFPRAQPGPNMSHNISMRCSEFLLRRFILETCRILVADFHPSPPTPFWLPSAFSYDIRGPHPRLRAFTILFLVPSVYDSCGCLSQAWLSNFCVLSAFTWSPTASSGLQLASFTQPLNTHFGGLRPRVIESRKPIIGIFMPFSSDGFFVQFHGNI